MGMDEFCGVGREFSKDARITGYLVLPDVKGKVRVGVVDSNGFEISRHDYELDGKSKAFLLGYGFKPGVLNPGLIGLGGRLMAGGLVLLILLLVLEKSRFLFRRSSEQDLKRIF